MRISLDARMAGLPGIGRFTLELWAALIERGVDVVALWRTHGRTWLGDHAPQPSGPVSSTRFRPFGPLEQLELPRLLRRSGAVVHHATHLTVPYRARVPIVLTVHDLFPLRDRANPRSAAAGLYYRAAFPRAVRRADVVVADSADTSRDLELTLGVEDARVIELGIDRDRWTPPTGDVVDGQLTSLGVRPPYLLYVGTAKRHKNLATLLAAHRKADLPQLVLAGATPAEVQQATDADLPPHVAALGRVSDTQLRSLYAGAVALALPSLYEAVGLTVWEAMAAGTPVVSSDGGALPETVGDAGLLVPALDVAAWRDALTRIVDDGALRRRLVERGYQHVAPRTWGRTADAYIELYRSLA